MIYYINTKIGLIKAHLVIMILLLWIPGAIYGQEKLFSAVDASKSGLHFNNKVEDHRNHNILIYSNYYGGAGVGIADLDQDGLKDIVLAGNLVPNKVFKNLGNLTFEEISITNEPDSSWTSSVLLGDVNNDGLIDIYYTCELYDEKPHLRKNKLFLNQGNFQFSEVAEQYGIANTERTRNATFIDYDRDGDLDLFLLNQPPNPGNYSPYNGINLRRKEWAPRMYRNENGEYFTDVTEETGLGEPCYPNSVIAADLNNDGWQDLYVSNDYEAPDFLYHNNQDGTFTNIIDDAMKHISYYSMGVDAADIDNDGLLDLMTLDMVAEDNYRLKSNMGGMYPKAFWNLVNTGGHYQYMFNTLQWNRGQDKYSEIGQMANVSSTDWSWSNIMADFNNDGWKDIYVTNGLLRDIRNSDMAKKFPAYVSDKIQKFIKENPNAGEVHVLDIIDLQKALDLHPSIEISNYVFENNGDLTFSKRMQEWGLDEKAFSNGCAYGDLDNDGDLDIVVNNINKEVSLYENNSDKMSSSNYLRVQPRLANLSVQGARVRIFHDGTFQDYEFANQRGMYSTSESIAHFGVGDYPFIDSIHIYLNGNKYRMGKVETNQLLEVDLASLSKNPYRFYTENNKIKQVNGITYKHEENEYDDYAKQVLLPHRMSTLGPCMAIGDVNGDKREDIYFGASIGKSGQLFIQNIDGSFKEVAFSVPQKEINYEDTDAIFFDVDNDGDLDLYVVSGGNEFAPRNKHYLDRMYLNDGKGNFSYVSDVIPRILESGGCIRTIDYDNDGDLDLFVGGRHKPWDYPSAAISRLLENKGGYYEDVTKEAARDLIYLGMITSAEVKDVDNDGWQDLLIVGEWMPITYLKNDKGVFSKTPLKVINKGKMFATDGWWNSIIGEDIDQDGDIDFLVGNNGLNYKYKATQAEPFEVHYDDFDGNGSKDIVLSYYNFGEQFPLRGRSCSSQQIPSLKKQFPTYDLFADANLVEVYGEEKLEQAIHYSVHTFASGLLRNEGSYWEFIPFPNQAQLSSIHSIVPIKIKNERYYYLAGNNYHAEIETQRNDASYGSVIKWENGKWKYCPALLPHVDGDVREAAGIKIYGRSYLINVVNDGPPVFLEIEKDSNSQDSGGTH